MEYIERHIKTIASAANRTVTTLLNGGTKTAVRLENGVVSASCNEVTSVSTVDGERYIIFGVSSHEAKELLMQLMKERPDLRYVMQDALDAMFRQKDW